MRRGVVAGAMVLALVLVGSLAGGAFAAVSALQAVPSSVPGFAPRPAAPARTVTLLTGDRVTVYGEGRISATPRPGTRLLSYRIKDHRYVIPSDALPLLRTDRLDRRLFDVTGLLAANYDRRADLPLIVAGGAAPRGLVAERRLAAVRGFATRVRTDALARQWDGLRSSLSTGKVWLDGLRTVSLDVSVPQIGAPAAWAAGFDGTGVTVAVLDTGIDSTHPDLAGQVTAERNFAAEEDDALDHVGHGTHVASTIAGTGAGSGGRYRGVAPGATLLDGKVCVAGGCAESWILAGMQWAAESGADVVNMSLSGPDTPDIDPLEQAVNDLTAQFGVLFVTAAGNAGADESVGSPATADAALAVGAVTKTDEYADFSSRGPRLGDHAVKPDVTAPGVEIVAARGKDADDGGEPGQLYIGHSGTSMATPHVAGAAAILAQVHPQWSPGQLKGALMASAAPNPGIGVFAQGAGRVDVARAIGQAITTSPSSVTFGLQDFPHDDDEVRTRGITYHNPTAASVTLSLTLTTGAPPGIFSLSVTSVTVPAGGSSTVELTADTRVGGDVTGGLGGQVTATAPGVRVQTSFGVVRDIQRAHVRVRTIDRAGQPAAEPLTVLVNTATGEEFVFAEPDATVRLVPGTYFAFSFVRDLGNSTDLLVYPRLIISGDQDVLMDGRQARAYDVTVPHKQAASVGTILDVSFALPEHGIGLSLLSDTFASIYSAHLGPADVPGVVTQVLGLFARPDGSGRFTGSPYSYQLGWFQRGNVYNGLKQHVRQRDLATVVANYHANAVASSGLRTNIAIVPDTVTAWGLSLDSTLPATRSEYFAGNVAWQTNFEELVAGDEKPTFLSEFSAPATTYAAGRRYHETWNNAVFAPSLTPADPQFPFVGRFGNVIYLEPPLYTDASGRRGVVNTRVGHAALYRNGQLVGEVDEPFGFFEVPPEPASYRLEVRQDHPGPLRLSTRTELVWTFTSARVDDETAVSLPLTAVGFDPPVDSRNRLRAGTRALIPVTVTSQPGAGRVTRLAVEVSFDDGRSWRRATVVRTLGHWILSLTHPKRAGFVSLRAEVADAGGNTVRETILRAYEIR